MTRASRRRGGRKGESHVATPDLPSYSIPPASEVTITRPGGRPRSRPDHVSGDKAYSSRRNRRHLRRRDIKHTIPEPKDQRANRRRRGSAGGKSHRLRP